MSECKLVRKLLKLCQKANIDNMQTIVDGFYKIIKQLRWHTFKERVKMEDSLVISEKNGIILNKFLDMTGILDRDICYTARYALFQTIGIMSNNDKNSSPMDYMKAIGQFLMMSGITEKAAEYLMEVHPLYMHNKLAQLLVVHSMLILRYSTRDSVDIAMSCCPKVKQAAYMYLDPEDNDPLSVLYAALIIDSIEPDNHIHEMLFYPVFLEKAVSGIQKSLFIKQQGYHSTNVVYRGGGINFALQSSLSIVNILIRSEDYKCALVDQLLEPKSQAVYRSIFKHGTNVEQQKTIAIFQMMSEHVCKKHDQKMYFKLLLATTLGFETLPFDIKSEGDKSMDDSSASNIPGTLKASCTLAKRSTVYIYDILKIPDVFFKHDHNRCFCNKCMTSREDGDVYQRGEPPKSYVLPRGWCRFSLKLPPRATSQEVLKKWHIAYHGTSDTCILPILNTGDLLMPGDKTAETEIKPQVGHYNEETKPDDFNIKQVFLSPSMKYAGSQAYASKKVYENPQNSGEFLSARVGFQVRIQPEKYSVEPETTGATGRNFIIDRHIKNTELEWSRDLRGVVILTGILVKVEEVEDE